MIACQEIIKSRDDLGLRNERLGPLPLINHFLDRLNLESRINRFVPTNDRRIRLQHSKAIGVLLRSILVEREPIYRQAETVNTFAPSAFGLNDEEVKYVCDDAVGRSLDRLFDADRESLLTDIIVAAVKEFDIVLDELHNDSTTVRFCGQYKKATGRRIRSKRAPFITQGFSKDHRGDLKQLLFILTTSEDGGIPVQFRCEDGNTGDVKTHEETWDALCQASGRSDFLYVADSKLCSRAPMNHISGKGGRFICVMPRNRKEDSEFREWIQTHVPKWEMVRDRRNPRRKGGPRDRWWTFRSPFPSFEGWAVVWLYSSLLKERQERTRRERITRSIQDFEDMNAKLSGPRPRLRTRDDIEEAVDKILRKNKVVRYLRVRVYPENKYFYRQSQPGRPGPNTKYIRKTKRHWQVGWEINQEAIEYDCNSDGMYPLLTNDRTLTDAQVFEAHKRQPTIEKRFSQMKSIFEITPVLLKNEGRIEAFFFVYFLSLLVQAIIERELRQSMKNNGISCLPLYPEERKTYKPTAEQVFRLFAFVQRNVLTHLGSDFHVFPTKLTELQSQILDLLGVMKTAFQVRSEVNCSAQ